MQQSRPVIVDWRTANSCAGGNCVEVAALDGEIMVRDSKNPDGPVLVYSGDEWQAFLAGAKNGDFDSLT